MPGGGAGVPLKALLTVENAGCQLCVLGMIVVHWAVIHSTRATWLAGISWQSSATRPQHWIATTSLLCERALAHVAWLSLSMLWHGVTSRTHTCVTHRHQQGHSCAPTTAVRTAACTGWVQCWWRPLLTAVGAGSVEDAGQQRWVTVTHSREGTCKLMHDYQLCSVSSPKVLCTCCIDM